MKRLVSFILVFLLTVTISFVSTEHRVYSQIESQTAPTVNFKKHFQDLAIEGSIAIYDRNSDHFYQHNPERNDTAFLPASTYKSSNSLIALETGIVNSDVDVLT